MWFISIIGTYAECGATRAGEARKATRSAQRGRAHSTEPAGPRRADRLSGGDSVGSVYFTAPAITPATNCRWKAKKTASGITIDMKAPGPRMSMLLPNCLTCC